MPRRIPDYPDSFALWNFVSSLGSIISLIATVFFIFIIYNELKIISYNKIIFILHIIKIKNIIRILLVIIQYNFQIFILYLYCFVISIDVFLKLGLLAPEWMSKFLILSFLA